MSTSYRLTLLVLRAQSGDRRALDKLLRSVQEPLYRLIRGIVGEDSRSEDVLQDVFLLICRKLRWLREPQAFRGWAFRVASREAVRCVRRDRRWREQERDETLLEEIPAEFAPTGESLDHMIQGVSPASRAVLVLHYGEQLPLAEVADVLGIPLGTVKSRLAYGLSLLRNHHQEKSHEP